MFVFNSCSSSNNQRNDQAISFPDHSFLHFPSPFDDDAAAPLLLQQPQHDILFHQIPFDEPPSTTFVNALGSESTRLMVTDHHDGHHVHQNLIIMKQQMRSTSPKRDRHSKINTLRGPRDRRMRLSLPVAREFFGLQDMLGVDKASKTVEWLLFQARHAIKKLSTDQQSCGRDDNGDTRSTPSSVSDGEEVVSGIIIDEMTTTTTTNINTKDEGRIKATTTKKEKVRSSRIARKTAFHPLAREYREKARARARARTQEKQRQIRQIRQKMLLPSSSSDANPIIMEEQIEGRKQMENGEEIITQIDDQHLRRNNQEIIIDDGDDHDCLMIMGGRWSPSNSIYNSLHNNNNGSPQEHPFGDFQFFGKLPWEPYNNHGIC